MTRTRTNLLVRSMAVALAGLAAAAAFAQPPDPLSKAPTWQPPDPAEVKAQAFAWLEENKADDVARAKATELWTSVPDQPTGPQLLACLVGTFALVDQDAAGLVELCSHPKTELLLPSQPWVTDPKTPPLVANNIHLFYGRWLVHEALYDEALGELSGLKPGDVVAPACLLFYQAAVYHKLLNKDAGLKAIEQLLEGIDQSPRRYIAVAQLMQQDLEALEDGTLDHIARRMDDIRRRLDLGRAGKKVRRIEDDVIKALDELIKKLEEQQQQQQGSGSGSSSNNIRSARPAPDSQIIGGKGRGDVTKRRIGAESGWGDLPPKEREEALQQIGREFPSHYRDVIEQYFRRLAAEGSE